MGMGFEEYATRLLEINNKDVAERHIKRLEQEGRQKVIRELLVDPRWEMYAAEVDKKLQIASAAVDNLGKLMLEGDLDVFKKLMPDYRYNLGIKKAFEEALLIVKEAQTS